ncbi:MAG: acyl-ACP--UDP-N-acetylglucosamine O-acyltransferase [Pseudomonadota bacterium]
MTTTIHPSAVVHDGAELGTGVEIGPFCEVSSHAKIGDGVRMHGRSTIMGATVVGEGCELFPGSVLGGRAQSLGSRDDPQYGLVVGARTIFREGSSANAGSSGGDGVTRVGSDCYFMTNTHAGHDCQVGDKCVFANNVAFGGHSVVGDQVWAGGGAIIHQFTQVGDHAFIGGGAIVVGDVLPFAMVAGNRASLAGVNINGLKRRGFSRDEMKAIRAVIKTLYSGDGAFSDRVQTFRETLDPDSPQAKIIEFIDRPSRSRPLCTPE